MKFSDWKYQKKMERQRAKRKYSDDMCWSIYDTLLEILPKMIETMRVQKHGYPDGIEFDEVKGFPCDWVRKQMEELEKEFSVSDYEQPDIADPFTQWHLILMRIVYCLTQADENQTEILNKYEEEYRKQLWKNVHDSKSFKDYIIPCKYDEKGKATLYKMNTSEVDKELEQNWLKETKNIGLYRDNMKTEALNLINKYFWNLWD